MPAMALSGAELLEHILRKLRRELEQHPDFAVAITHPRVQWDAVITLKLPLHEKPERVHQVADDTFVPPPGPPSPAPPFRHRKPTEIRVGSELITAPDKARDEVGLVKPERQTVPGGGVADYPAGPLPWEK